MTQQAIFRDNKVILSKHRAFIVGLITENEICKQLTTCTKEWRYAIRADGRNDEKT